MTGKGRRKGPAARSQGARGAGWWRWAAFDIDLHLDELLGHPA